MSDDLADIADALARIADALERIADAMTPDGAAADEYERGRDDERADVLAYMANDFVGYRDGLPWGVDNFTEGIRDGDHVGQANP